MLVSFQEAFDKTSELLEMFSRRKCFYHLVPPIFTKLREFAAGNIVFRVPIENFLSQFSKNAQNTIYKIEESGNHRKL